MTSVRRSQPHNEDKNKRRVPTGGLAIDEKIKVELDCWEHPSQVTAAPSPWARAETLICCAREPWASGRTWSEMGVNVGGVVPGRFISFYTFLYYFI